MSVWHTWVLASALAFTAGCGGGAGGPAAGGTAGEDLSPSDKLKRDLDAEEARAKAAAPAPPRP